MKRLSFALAASLAATSLVYAANHFDSDGGQLGGVSPIYIMVSAGASQYGLSVTTNTTLTVPAGATIAEICVETAGIRYTSDGTSATASVGMPVSSGTCYSYSGPLSALKFTAQTGLPTIDVEYFKAK